MLEVKREEGETIEHLLRRYTEKLKRVNFFNTVKTRAFHRRQVTKRAQRVSALYRARKREKMEYLRRIGKIDDGMFDRPHYR